MDNCGKPRIKESSPVQIFRNLKSQSIPTVPSKLGFHSQDCFYQEESFLTNNEFAVEEKVYKMLNLEHSCLCVGNMDIIKNRKNDSFEMWCWRKNKLY